MEIQYHPYALYLFLSALITLTASFVAWRRPVPGASTLCLLLLSMTVWSGSYAVRWLDLSASAKLLAFNVMYIGILALPILFLIFTLELTHNGQWLTRRNLFLLSVQPAFSLLLLWTNDLHHWYYASIQAVQTDGLTILEFVRGPYYFVNLTFSYATLITALGLIFIAALRLGPLFRNQYRLILIGLAIPWASSIYNELDFINLHGLDLTPVSFGISGILFVFGVLRAGLMDLVPVARSLLIENMSDGVMVLDRNNRIVDINLAMQKLFVGETSSALLGKDASAVLGQWMDKTEPLRSEVDSQTEMRSPGDPSRFLDLRVTPLFDAYKQVNGRLIVFRDVTDRKVVEKKLRNANYRLQSQLIEIGTLQSQLREQAVRDPLTNLFNRRYLEETLDRELERAAREKYCICIIMVDIDRFKQVNDTYGHEAGDFVLKATADVLKRQSRRGDFACRFGGEEFVIVMPNINKEIVYERAGDLRASLNSLRVPYGRYTLSATFSIGIACYPSNGDTRESLLRAADRAMYAAKEAGRDHIRTYDELAAIKD